MTKAILFSVVAAFFMSAVVYAQGSERLVSTKSQVKFHSSTPAEDIEASNTASLSTINKNNGEVVFSVPMQGFQFEKALMQKHFNSDKFLDTKTHPRARLKAKITNIDKVNFSKDGTYEAIIEGELTIKGVINKISEKGTVSVNEEKVEVLSKFNVTLADYGITFGKGKPSTNIAKTVVVTVKAEYQPE